MTDSEDGASEDREYLGLALDHSWGWFSVHSTQRMQLINYFVVSLAFLAAAYGSTLKDHQSGVASVVAIFGALLCLAFNRLDRRTRELVKASEGALRNLEDVLWRKTGFASTRLVETVETSKYRFSSYSNIIDSLHIVVALIFIAAATYALTL